MKVLVLTSEPITAEQLREALDDNPAPQEVEVMVVAPALQESGLKFWLSDADDAIARAEEVWRGTVQRLDSAGVAATGDTGESDPMDAIQDALQTFDADRIVLFTHENGQRYREDIDEAEIEERFGVPVAHASLSS
jgi:nucleotide-binding universal stress UspA family protein